VGASREYRYKLGYIEAAKDLISEGNFILIDKKNLANSIKAKSTNEHIHEIPTDDSCYAGLHNDIFRNKKTGGLIDIYAKYSSWISAGDDILFLDIAKTRNYVQDRGRITGKMITNQVGYLD
jgi:hypothetical protein